MWPVGIASHRLTDVLNVKWTDVVGTFDKGEVPVEVEEKSLAIADGTETVRAFVAPSLNLELAQWIWVARKRVSRN